MREMDGGLWSLTAVEQWARGEKGGTPSVKEEKLA